MTKTHYQAPWIDKPDHRALCNDQLESLDTSIYIDDVDCKRCIKQAASLERRGRPIRKKGFVNGLIYSIRWALL